MNWFCRFVFFLLTCSVCLGATNTRKGRITGGREAEPHSNPYVVSLQSRYLWKRYYRHCTGSILSERWILSSGHCVTDSWAKWLELDAIVGAHNLAWITTSMIYPISHRIAHPMYRGGVGPYDIAMMRTSRDIHFSDEVQPISLPMASTNTYKNSDDLLIMGWGALQSNFFISEIPNKLQEAKVSYLPYIDCYRAVDRLKESYERNPLKRNHNICTGPIYRGVSGCTGDSGGPLVRYALAPSSLISAETTTEKETTTPMPSTSPSSTPMTTDKTSTTTTEATTTTTESTTTDRPSTTTRASTTKASSTSSPTTSSPTTSSPTTSSPTTSSPTTSSPTTSSPTTSSPTTSSSTTSSSTTSSYSISSTTTASDTSTLTTATEETISDTSYSAPRIRLENSRNYNIIGFWNRIVDNQRASNTSMIPTVVGVISWGVVPCGLRGAPTVYSNVSNYMDFINKYLYS